MRACVRVRMLACVYVVAKFLCVRIYACVCVCVLCIDVLASASGCCLTGVYIVCRQQTNALASKRHCIITVMPLAKIQKKKNKSIHPRFVSFMYKHRKVKLFMYTHIPCDVCIAFCILLCVEKRMHGVKALDVEGERWVGKQTK